MGWIASSISWKKPESVVNYGFFSVTVSPFSLAGGILPRASLEFLFKKSAQDAKRTALAMAEGDLFAITVKSELGEGAIGLTHGGTLMMQNSTDEAAIAMDVVVKLALIATTQDQLRHEHQVNADLCEAGITGIPFIVGLLEDKEDDATALVMTHCGRPLHVRGKVENDTGHSFLLTLGAIHKAGFVHGDLRPANLLINDKSLHH